ncbi:MAG: acetylglutamate kinase [Clostridia bacterium]
MYQRHRSCENIIMLNNTFRQLWEQHIMWTRSFIISTADNLGDLDPVTKRLLRNPSDFAAVLKTYYGNEQAGEFQRLFEEHLLIAADLVNQAKEGHADGVEAAREKWYQNADEIAVFLSEINPYWSRREWSRMLNEHLEMTEEEAVTRLQGQFQRNVALYDDIEHQALAMADYMTKGILKQFH